MRIFIISVSLFFTLACTAFADTASPTPVLPIIAGWGPSVVGSVGAFYLNGNYSLLSAGVNIGSAYTWDHNSNVNSVGIYIGPQSQQANGITTTTINSMVYANLYKTTAGSLGIGIGTRIWESGIGVKAIRSDTTFLALGYQF